MYTLNKYTRVYDAEKMRRARGIYTDEQVDRCSQLGGQFGHALEKLFLNDITGVHSSNYTPKRHSKCSDVNVFLENYRKYDLWQNVPGRCHAGFEKMKHEWRVKDCGKLAKRLHHLSNRLDLWKTFSN